MKTVSPALVMTKLGINWIDYIMMWISTESKVSIFEMSIPSENENYCIHDTVMPRLNLVINWIIKFSKADPVWHFRTHLWPIAYRVNSVFFLIDYWWKDFKNQGIISRWNWRHELNVRVWGQIQCFAWWNESIITSINVFPIKTIFLDLIDFDMSERVHFKWEKVFIFLSWQFH